MSGTISPSRALKIYEQIEQLKLAASTDPENIVKSLEAIQVSLKELSASDGEAPKHGIGIDRTLKEQKYQSIVERSRDGIILTDEDGRIIEWNPSMEAHTGLKQEDVLGRHLWDVQFGLTANWHRTPELYEKIKTWAKETLKTGRSSVQDYPMDVEILRPNGTVLAVEEMLNIIPTEKGFMICGILRDISKRKRMEEELQQSKDELQQKVLERTEDLSMANLALQAEIVERKRAEEMICIQRDLGIALSSAGDLKEALNLILDACLKLRGVDCGGIYVVDKNLGDLRLVAHTKTGLPREFIEHGSHYDSGSFHARLVMEGRPIYASYSRIRSESSEVYPMEDLRAISILPVKCREKVTAVLNMASHTIDERPIGIRSTLEAIAAQVGEAIEKLKAEEDRKQAEERVLFQASLLDQVRNSVIATDLHGTIIYWSRFAEALYQWKAEEILGKNIAKTIVPKEKSYLIREVMAQITSSGYYEAELLVRRKDGNIFPAIYTYSLLKDLEGKHIGYVSVSIDLTERKKIERDLRLAKELAESAAKAKSDFLANMSHEIRTPMNAVIGLTGLLQRTDLNKEQQDYVETIRSSGNSLLSVINNILDFSKIDSGKVELEAQPFNLRDCVEDSLDLVATEASKKGLNLAYSIDTSAPGTIMGDPVRLRQILINLLSNAVKFTDSGEVMMAVSGRKLEGNDHEVHFAIKDTGIGISKDRMNQLFKPFSQMEPSTTRIYGGTGLGLAISKRLVEMMGGRIWAESEVGNGSTFHFTILVAATAAKPASSMTIALQPQTDLKLSQSPALRILLAEDNPVNQKVAMQMLRKIGYEADVAANGLEVLQALERQPYDIILMDVQMPEMDGLEAAKNIRERWHNGPKIIAITAYALEGDRDRCLNVGMDDYISKPIQMDELQSKLVKWGIDNKEQNVYQ
ncbi:MAG TPA: PAS domain S-box protein [Methanotrichaceae archaeon]|nr:PAS domain S-box protein [Methanotrichaceae archaeon]